MNSWWLPLVVEGGYEPIQKIINIALQYNQEDLLTYDEFTAFVDKITKIPRQVAASWANVKYVNMYDGLIFAGQMEEAAKKLLAEINNLVEARKQRMMGLQRNARHNLRHQDLALN